MMLRTRLGALLICLSAVAVPVAVAAGESSAAGAGSADWQQFAEEPNGDVYFYDPTRVEGSDTVRRVWIGIRYKTSVMGASSFRSLSEIDCSEMTGKILQSTFFSDRQWTRPAMKTDMNDKPKTKIAAGSARARLAEILCD